MSIVVYVYGDAATPVVRACADVLRALNVPVASCPRDASVAIAPLLTRRLTEREIAEPSIGTLIFHPSLLPRHRGRDAIKWAFHAGETYTGATWFWAAPGYDTGDVCEQEVLEISHGESPRDFYGRAVIPACARLLEYALRDIDAGHVRRRPQRTEAATHEPPFPRPVTRSE